MTLLRYYDEELKLFHGHDDAVLFHPGGDGFALAVVNDAREGHSCLEDDGVASGVDVASDFSLGEVGGAESS